MTTLNNERKERTANIVLTIGGVSFSADSLVVAESFVLRIKFSAKNPAHRQYAARCVQSPYHEKQLSFRANEENNPTQKQFFLPLYCSL